MKKALQSLFIILVACLLGALITFLSDAPESTRVSKSIEVHELEDVVESLRKLSFHAGKEKEEIESYAAEMCVEIYLTNRYGFPDRLDWWPEGKTWEVDWRTRYLDSHAIKVRNKLGIAVNPLEALRSLQSRGLAIADDKVAKIAYNERVRHWLTASETHKRFLFLVFLVLALFGIFRSLPTLFHILKSIFQRNKDSWTKAVEGSQEYIKKNILILLILLVLVLILLKLN